MKKAMYYLWGGLLALCAGMGFLPNPQGIAWWALLILAVLSFVPPAVIVWESWKENSQKDLMLLRNLAMGSIGLTLICMIGNFLSMAAPEWVGDLLHGMLVVVSTPMVCAQVWIVSLVLWAALMWTCILLKKK